MTLSKEMEKAKWESIIDIANLTRATVDIMFQAIENNNVALAYYCWFQLTDATMEDEDDRPTLADLHKSMMNALIKDYEEETDKSFIVEMLNKPSFQELHEQYITEVLKRHRHV